MNSLKRMSSLRAPAASHAQRTMPRVVLSRQRSISLGLKLQTAYWGLLQT